ncbi:MAG: hypothetical protein NW201_13665 [Gemmatimonadales bacterium]|nr:hypothetical protein [Gemmatimonadales bacterium]
MPAPARLASVRALAGAALLLGLVGTVLELLLLAHWEEWTQWLPLLLLGASLGVLGWFRARPGPAPLRAHRALMTALAVAGVVGIGLHVRGNVLTQREVDPTLAGRALAREVLTRGAPVLAPGALLQLALIGLAWAYRHPADPAA